MAKIHKGIKRKVKNKTCVLHQKGKKKGILAAAYGPKKILIASNNFYPDGELILSDS